MIHIANLQAHYPRSKASALENFSLDVDKGEFVILFGPTGSGKSTVLQLIIGGLYITRGEVMVGPFPVHGMKTAGIGKLRRSLGMVFQDLKLLQDKTVEENISFPLELQKRLHSEALRRQVEETMTRFGLTELAESFPRDLAMGELQRVAIARAVVTEPLVLLADEPTAQLDVATSHQILDRLSREHLRGMTILLGTSDERVVDYLPAARVITLEEGKILESSGKPRVYDAVVG